MIELALGDADGTAWEALDARAERFSAGQERIEMMEARALAAARAGRAGEARRWLTGAIHLAEKIPNAISSRLRRRLAEIPAS
jgi:hypothetical protein